MIENGGFLDHDSLQTFHSASGILLQLLLFQVFVSSCWLPRCVSLWFLTANLPGQCYCEVSWPDDNNHPSFPRLAFCPQSNSDKLDFVSYSKDTTHTSSPSKQHLSSDNGQEYRWKWAQALCRWLFSHPGKQLVEEMDWVFLEICCSLHKISKSSGNLPVVLIPYTSTTVLFFRALKRSTHLKRTKEVLVWLLKFY